MKEIGEECKTAAVSEMTVDDAALSADQLLKTDVRHCSNSVKESDAENVDNDSTTESADISSSSLFVPVTLYVNSQTEMTGLVSHLHGTASTHHLMLTGLHTCGDLSVNILRQFVSTLSVHVVCQVACCYNLLTETFPLTPTEAGNISLYSAALIE